VTRQFTDILRKYNEKNPPVPIFTLLVTSCSLRRRTMFGVAADMIAAIVMYKAGSGEAMPMTHSEGIQRSGGTVP
jgi:hypothetical protein